MNFIFTYDGFRLPKHVIQSINVCKANNTKSEIYLVVNKKLRIPKKLYKICKVYRVKENNNLEFKRILDAKYEVQQHSQNGFWFKSILRFFYIETFIEEHNFKGVDFIHLEADCLSFVDEKIYLDLRNKYKKISCPMDIEGNCIPSIVYFPNKKSAIDFSKYIKEKIIRGVNMPNFYCNDIQMLNEYARKGKISFLKSLPEKDEEVIFDPAYIGEFLFGKDIRHNQFILQSGYIPIKQYSNILKKFSLKFDQNENRKRRFLVNFVNQSYVIANIHNYSKRDDLFFEEFNLSKISEILKQISENKYRRKFMLRHLLLFIFDKCEYYIRVKLKSK